MAMRPAALAVLLAACGGSELARRPDILLVSLDALRADHLSAAGYPRATTPFLDQLAAGGVRFANAFANTHSTPPSHATILTSLYQESHRVSFGVGGREIRRVPEALTTLPELLRDAGYATLAVTGGGYVSRPYRFDQGFDRFFDEVLSVDEQRRRLVEELHRSDRDRPLFVFFHTYEIHSPYDAPEPFRELFGGGRRELDLDSEALLPFAASAGSLEPGQLGHLAALYDAGIRWTDTVLRALYAELDRLGFLERALVVVTSDHGEELGEHGGLLHRGLLYDELVRVPLIFAGRGVPSGVIDERLVSSIDIAPTILRHAGLAPPPLMAGRDLLGDPGAAASPDDAVFMQFGHLRYAVRTRRWKLIETVEGRGGVELYDLDDDPREQVDLAAEAPERVAELRRRLHAWRRSCPRIDGISGGAPAIPEHVRRRLETLGYVE